MSEKQKKDKKKLRLVVFDESSLKEIFNIKLSKGNIFAYGGVAVIIIATLTAVLILTTPLKYLLPPVDNVNLKNKIIKNSISIDSLEKQIKFRDNYFQEVQNIIEQKNIDKFAENNTLKNDNILTQKQKDSILEQLIDRDQKDLEEIRQNEFSPIVEDKFHRPVKGKILETFDPTKSHYGVDIETKQNAEVVAVSDGVVTLVIKDKNNGYTVQIQHKNNIISIYKNNSKALKKEGEDVGKNEPIAVVGNDYENPGKFVLHFEIWINGNPINPVEFINF